MEDFKRILVVSRYTLQCQKAVHYGVSLAQKYEAELTVIHTVYEPFLYWNWNLLVPNVKEVYQKALQQAKTQLDKIIDLERQKGMAINSFIVEGKPTEHIVKTVKDKNIDLLIMLAHEEGHLEHFLFAGSNDEIIRQLPCSVLFVKKEPEAVNS
jgi:nucleotide-binding universal stress UspA family protein